METFVGALGTVIAVYVLLRSERGEWSRQFVRLETGLKGEIAGLRTELKGDIAGLRTELKGDIAGLRTELKGDVAGLRTEIRGVNGRIDRVMDALVRHVQEGHPPHQAA